MKQSRKVTTPNTENMEKEALQALNRKDDEAIFWPEEVLHLINYIKELHKYRERLEKLERWLTSNPGNMIDQPNLLFSEDWSLLKYGIEKDVEKVWKVAAEGKTLVEAIDNLEVE